MIFISHRGNIECKDAEFENNPNYILNAVNSDFDCEVDLWVVKNKLYLGHDEPQYEINSKFLINLKENLWVHCKNIDAVHMCFNLKSIHYFWHENDKITLTSRNIIWAYPGNQPISQSIAVMPELNEETQLFNSLGICSDKIFYYKEKYEKI